MRGGEPIKASLLTATLYLLVGAASYALLRIPGWPHAIWPASGIAFGLLLTRQAGRLEGVALGSFLLWLPIQLLEGASWAVGLLAAAGLSLSCTLPAAVGALIVRHRLGSTPGLQRARQILEFLTLPGPVACLLGATLAVAVLRGTEQLAADQVQHLWLSWWAGDAIGVMVFAPVTLMAMPAQRHVWRGRRTMVAIPSLFLLALCLLGLLHLAKLELEADQIRLTRRATLAKETLERTIALHQEALWGLRSLIETIGEPSVDEFRRYTAGHLDRLRGLSAISWNPEVSAEAMEVFEARQRQRNGRPGFRISERTEAGALVPAHGRPTVVPVTLIEPWSANQQALGFDISSEPVRAEAIRRARTTGRPSATAPIELVQERGDQTGVLLILPIQEPRGFVVGVYRLGVLLQNCFADVSWRAFQIRLLAPGDGETEREAARKPKPGASIARAQADRQLRVSEVVDMGGVPWRLVLEREPLAPGWFAVSDVALIPLGGVLIAVLLEGFLLLSSGQERQQQRDLQRKLRLSLTAAAKAHEIKQPLARLLLQASTLKGAWSRMPPETASDSNVRSLAEGIARDAKQVSEAIDGIRNLLGSDDRSMTVMNLTEVVHSSLLILNHEMGALAIQLETQGLGSPHWILGEPGQLQVMLTNLVRNAMTASGVGGRISIAISESAFDVLLEISDDGPGFPVEIKSFDELFLRSRTSEGMGLGLFLVGCAVENHQGEIQVDRSPLGGACVQILLPSIPSGQRPTQATTVTDGRFRSGQC